MKIFKTERTIYFNTKYSQKVEPNKILSKHKESSSNKFISTNENYFPKFLNKKVEHFYVYKYDSLFWIKLKVRKKEGEDGL